MNNKKHGQEKTWLNNNEQEFTEINKNEQEQTRIDKNCSNFAVSKVILPNISEKNL